MRRWAKLLLIYAYRCGSNNNLRCCADAFALDHSVACTRANRIKISKPLGIIVEEADANDPSQGVCIGSIDEGGNAASCGADICIHDAIVAVNGADCAAKSFEEVMDLIVSCETPEVELSLARLEGRDGLYNCRNPTCTCRSRESFVRLGFPYAIVERKDTIKLAVNKCFSSQILDLVGILPYSE